MPAILAGMTISLFPFSVGERKIMNHSVVDTSPQETQNSPTFNRELYQSAKITVNDGRRLIGCAVSQAGRSD
jgi:hypothetical protein